MKSHERYTTPSIADVFLLHVCLHLNQIMQTYLQQSTQVQGLQNSQINSDLIEQFSYRTQGCHPQRKIGKKIIMGCLRFKYHLVHSAWNVDFFLALEWYFGAFLSIQEQEKQNISADILKKIWCLFLLSLLVQRVNTLRK